MHKRVVNELFMRLFTSPHPEESIFIEFGRVYRHLIENLPLLDLPLTLIDKPSFIEFVENTKQTGGITDPDIRPIQDSVTETPDDDD